MSTKSGQDPALAGAAEPQAVRRLSRIQLRAVKSLIRLLQSVPTLALIAGAAVGFVLLRVIPNPWLFGIAVAFIFFLGLLFLFWRGLSQGWGSSLVRVLLSLAFMAFAVYELYRGIVLLRAGLLANSWLSADGTVISAIVEPRPSRGIPSFLRSRKDRVVITYRYTVAGVSYKSSLRAFGERTLSGFGRRRIVETLDQYPIGSFVKVYYSPRKLGVAVLEPGATSTATGMVGGGGACLLLGLWGLLGLGRHVPDPDAGQFDHASYP